MTANQTRLFFGRPIPLDEKISIIQPKLGQIIDMGDRYDNYLLPYTITLDTIFDDTSVIGDLTLFELFFEKFDDETYVLQGAFNNNPIELLSESITFFTGQEVKILENRKKVIIGDSYILDKVNYEHFRKIIQAVSTRKDLVVEKMPKGLSERRKDIWLKIQEGRRRKAQRESLGLEDIANVICFGGSSYISLDEIMNMTYYQFFNAYKSILGKDSYFIALQYKVSQKYEYKEELAHWSKDMKIKSDLD